MSIEIENAAEYNLFDGNPCETERATQVKRLERYARELYECVRENLEAADPEDFAYYEDLTDLAERLASMISVWTECRKTVRPHA